MSHKMLAEVSKLKARELPAYLRSSLSPEKVTAGFDGWVRQYHDTHIKKDSIAPLNQLVAAVFVLAYAVGWPAESRHMAHEEAKKHGGGHH
eukprot:SM000068S20565  [mRNA]  locus=s68:113047:113319:- [translate_table: standard]